ncbi:hypothetical protein DVR12_17435 [Chitinophaga silvatica]|uniref:Uncharacterized protein n=1 Tax=Chitinophaga silvatica TaxID=2282649 RepID=A0A3E1Y7R3_9BACT|nr:hypothetical protein [Chitinophaga silvatica]RFS21120.1 hypothetical protein DVR12_17435 [Chitinophaga silvatica]
MSYRSFIVLPLLVCFLAINSQAQTLKNFLDNKDSSFTWLGIDFTQARLIGDAGANLDDIIPRHFAGINQVVVNEPKKYDIAGAFHHNNFNSDISLVNKRNESVNKETFKSDNTSDFTRLTNDDIIRQVKSYDFAGKKGIGIMMFVEAMNKTGKQLSAYVTFVDMGKKNVLLTERMTAKTGMGWGFRNFWALPVSYVLNHFDSDYNKIKEKYANAQDPEEEKPVAPAAKKDTKTGVAVKEETKKQPKKKG